MKRPCNNYNLMYICLPRLIDVKGRVGELAKFLMGFEVDIIDETVGKIADCFRKSFETFKDDKEAVKTMSIDEKARYEAKDEEKVATAFRLIGKGYPVPEIDDIIQKSIEWVEELLATEKPIPN